MLGRSQTKKRDDALTAWLRKKGRAVPEQLEEQEPQLDADLVPIFSSWTQLMDGRAVGNGEALSWSELSRYCEDHGVDGEARRRWCRLLKAMDRAYVAHINTRATDGNAGTGNRRDQGAAGRAGGSAGVRPGAEGG